MRTTSERHDLTPALDADACWQASLSRDARFADAFVYGVRSTGVYCRPTCPSRRPQRSQVSFFASAGDAERAGFRACRRCRPHERGSDTQASVVASVCAYVEERLGERITLAGLSAHVGLSPHHLSRTFKRAVGLTPSQYLRARRLNEVKASLRAGQPVLRALYWAGYGSTSRLYERAPAELGMTPGTYSQGGTGMQIAYTTSPCSLGRLLVAATHRGICFVGLGDADAALEAELVAEYPSAEIRRDDGSLDPWVQAIAQHLDGRPASLDLPLDVRGTAFQRHVWDALQAIPVGDTRSYGDIAAALGWPRGARAVGRACATNPASIVIPCHRAVGKNGNPAGYRWGVERKQRLLELEASAGRPAGPQPGE